MDSFLRNEISLEEYLATLDVQVEDLPAELHSELARRDLSHDFVWGWCKAARLFGHSRKLTPAICALLERNDHETHEDLAATLQDLRDPSSVDCLYNCATRRLPYLDYNDSAALARKCVWALHDIGTPEAVARLQLLADDDRRDVTNEVRKRLTSLAARLNGDADPPYRLARDSGLGAL
jgi:hypothetical protein